MLTPLWTFFSKKIHLSVPIHMKSWPKSKSGQVELVWTLLRITRLDPSQSYLVIICPNSHEKLTKSEIRSSYYLLQFGFIYPYLAPRYNFCPYLAYLKLSIFSLTYLYLPRLTYIWLYIGLMTLIWAYLPLIALVLPYVSYSPYISIILLRYCISKNWGYKSVITNAVWVLI